MGGIVRLGGGVSIEGQVGGAGAQLPGSSRRPAGVREPPGTPAHRHPLPARQLAGRRQGRRQAVTRSVSQ